MQMNPIDVKGEVAYLHFKMNYQMPSYGFYAYERRKIANREVEECLRT